MGTFVFVVPFENIKNHLTLDLIFYIFTKVCGAKE